MKVRTFALAPTMAALVMSIAGTAVAQIATTDVHFFRGKTSSVVSGTIKGGQIQDFVVRASEGQTMKIDLTGSKTVFFNVLPPGSTDEAIFVGSIEGNNFAGTLNTSGAYKVRVYQMRATARRGESDNFSLSISVTGANPATGHGAGAGGLAGIAGMDSIAAIDAMTDRGFANVDSLESGNTQYGIFYNRSSHMCAQLTMADGKVLDASDIKTHPKCH